MYEKALAPVVLATLLAACGGGGDGGGSRTDSPSITVTDTNGHPLAGATVVIHGRDGADIVTVASTDVGGHARLLSSSEQGAFSLTVAVTRNGYSRVRTLTDIPRADYTVRMDLPVGAADDCTAWTANADQPLRLVGYPWGYVAAEPSKYTVTGHACNLQEGGGLSLVGFGENYDYYGYARDASSDGDVAVDLTLDRRADTLQWLPPAGADLSGWFLGIRQGVAYPLGPLDEASAGAAGTQPIAGDFPADYFRATATYRHEAMSPEGMQWLRYEARLASVPAAIELPAADTTFSDVTAAAETGATWSRTGSMAADLQTATLTLADDEGTTAWTVAVPPDRRRADVPRLPDALVRQLRLQSRDLVAVRVQAQDLLGIDDYAAAIRLMAAADAAGADLPARVSAVADVAIATDPGTSRQ
ncbi:MAG: hypothetical protein PVF40_05140 [Ectothiorhodospiraceae bacterium]|jgi:hypothetical protein